MKTTIAAALVLFSLANIAQAKPELEPWASVLDSDSQDQINMGDITSDVVFSGLDRIQFFSMDYGDDSFSLSIDRKVFENPKQEGTWSVVDQLYMKTEIPIWGHALRWDGLGLKVGFESRLGYMNIRQVSPDDYDKLPSVDDRLKEIRSSDWYKALNPSKNKQSLNWVTSKNAQGQSESIYCPFPPEDTENRAKFCNFFERFTFPFRFPYKADDVAKLDDAEIISYLGTGQIEFGPHVGFIATPSDFADVGGGANFTYFLKGSFQISVRKDDNHHVRVTAGRATGTGWTTGLSANISPNILDGFFLIGAITRQLKVVPFDLHLTEENENAFSVTYRYDLDNSHAREAYEEAVGGRLALSDLLTVDELGQAIDPAISGVEKVETRKRDSDTETGHRKTRLGFIFKKDLLRRVRDVEITITTPAGVSRRFETTATNSRETRFLLKWFEKLKYYFTVSLNQTLAETDPNNPKVLRLTLAGDIDDSETHRNEMLSYIFEAENTAGLNNVFPRPPLREELMGEHPRKDVVLLPKHHFGRSHFQYQVELLQPDINAFLDVAASDSDQWHALERAFGVSEGAWSTRWARFRYMVFNGPWTVLNVPLYLADVNLRQGSMLSAASEIKDRWSDAAKARDARERTASLGRMFYSSYYSHELIRLVRDVLHTHNSEYLLSGYSPFFGQVIKRGENPLNRDDVSAVPPVSSDPSFTVSSLQLVKAANNSYDLKFNLGQQAETLFLQFRKEVTYWWFFKSVEKSELLVFSSPEQRLAAGANVLHLDPSDKDDPLYDVAQRLEAGEKYRFQLSVTPDGMVWGVPNFIDLKL